MSIFRCDHVEAAFKHQIPMKLFAYLWFIFVSFDLIRRDFSLFIFFHYCFSAQIINMVGFGIFCEEFLYCFSHEMSSFEPKWMERSRCRWRPPWGLYWDGPHKFVSESEDCTRSVQPRQWAVPKWKKEKQIVFNWNFTFKKDKKGRGNWPRFVFVLCVESILLIGEYLFQALMRSESSAQTHYCLYSKYKNADEVLLLLFFTFFPLNIISIIKSHFLQNKYCLILLRNFKHKTPIDFFYVCARVFKMLAYIHLCFDQPVSISLAEISAQSSRHPQPVWRHTSICCRSNTISLQSWICNV